MSKLTLKQIIILILVALLIVLFLFIIQSLGPKTPINNDNSPTPTPSPTLYSSQQPTTSPIESVNLNGIEATGLPSSAPTIKSSVTKFTVSSSQKIAETLGFSGAPVITKSAVNPLVSWNNDLYNLTINLNNSQIVMGNLSNSLIATNNDGFSKSPLDLSKDAISLLQKLNIFDAKLTIISTSVEYFISRPSYYEPATAASSNLITINLAPKLENYPIYIENKRFIKATYGTDGKLIKLIIESPLGQASKTNAIALLSLEDLKKLEPASFFPINISPENIREYYLSPPAITSIDPNKIQFGYVLKPSAPQLEPVFIVEKTDSGHLRYQFAVQASKD